MDAASSATPASNSDPSEYTAKTALTIGAWNI